MEPSALQGKRTAGRPGSLENPEVRQDVPGHIIPILEREFEDFETEATKFLDGQTPENQFIGFRLKQGVYGQRQPGVQMIRVKLPFGGITPEQMDAFADAIEQYVPLNKGHITTRQNIQMHHIPLKDATDVLRVLAPSGLSSREGCGNTVRNVTGDPWAGVCEDEVFDPTPYVGAYVRYFVRHPTTQLMPRKVKTAFDGTDEDRAITGIHDIAFLARERDGVRGFEVRLGGGTAIMPRIAPTLYDFVEADNGDYLKVAEAVFRVFDRQDWLRVNRARARIKVLVDKVGIDEVRRMVDEELEGDWVDERNFDIDPILFVDDEEANAPAPLESYATPNGDLSEFERFCRSSVQPQRQAGFSTVQVHVDRGDLSARAAPRPRRRSCATTRAATPGPPCTRTCSCAGCATRRSTRSGSGSPSSGSARPAPTRSRTSSAARAPTAASSASRARWASTPPSASACRRWSSPTR